MSTTTATKERPILFSGPMVRAILEGRKTQTRRIVKRSKAPECDTLMKRPINFGDGIEFFMDPANPMGPYLCCSCPYGQPGDHLWVRETWRAFGDSIAEKNSLSTCTGPKDLEYRADFTTDFDISIRSPWRPSIHMPRWASRLTLEVTSIRVERVQEISEADARAEGFGLSMEMSPSEAFLDTFYNLNKRAQRDQNPWVWVVSFKRIQQPTTAAPCSPGAAAPRQEAAAR